MVNENVQAVSVANRYFTLADGMVPGFKNHLAENVVLTWFGKKIIGRERVVAFIISNRTETFHRFSDIKPISGFACGKKESNRKKEPSSDQNVNKHETHMSNCFREAPTRHSHEAKMSTTRENVIDFNQKNNVNSAGFVHKRNCATYDIRKYGKNLKISIASNDVNIDVNRNEICPKTIVKMNKQHYNFNKNDLYNLYEPEITSQAIVGKIQNINRIKLKEEMAPTIRAINRECGQGDKPVIAEAKETKYLEAKGDIKFVRLSAQKDSPFLYYWSRAWKKKVWKRQCKLQIAYSLNGTSPKVTNDECYTVQKTARFACRSTHPSAIHGNARKIQDNKLPSLEEAIKISNTLIRDVNYFGGYLKPLNFLEDRENFLKSFEAEMMQKNPNMRSCAHYVKNKLMIDFPSKKPFNATYQIHMIVYTGIGTDEFSAQEITSDE